MVEDNVKKYQELYEYSKEIYLEEIRRFDLITQKATQYLSVISVILGLALVFGKWLISELIPPSSILSYAILATGTVLYLSLISAWLLNFEILRGGPLRKLPLNNTVIEFFKDNERIDILFAFSKRLKEGHSRNLIETNKRAKLMTWGHRSIIVAIVTLVSLTILGISYQTKVSLEESRGRKSIMTDENINETPAEPEVNPSVDVPKPVENPSGDVSVEPNPSIVAPMMDVITHGQEHVGVEKTIVDPTSSPGTICESEAEDTSA